jgi:hypothetical protein
VGREVVRAAVRQAYITYPDGIGDDLDATARFSPPPRTLPVAAIARWHVAARVRAAEEYIMKKQMKKIVLAKETLRSLVEPDVAAAQGGALPISGVNTCRCPTVSCKAGQC